MKMFKDKDQVILVANSNGVPISQKDKVDQLVKVLQNMGLRPVISSRLYATNGISSGTGAERAEVMMDAYKSADITAIFDISGGDIANEVLPYLDYNVIAKSEVAYFGYSDLTTVLNSIYNLSQNKGYLYQVKNLIGECHEVQQKEFYETFFEAKDSLYKFDYEFIQGDKINGLVVGGNSRCLLKLAGTKYMPNFKGKILFLEARGGQVPQITTFLNQYKQMGVLDEIKGIILGNFTEMESNNMEPTVVDILKEILGNGDIPIVKTSQIGHASDSKCIIIGECIELEKNNMFRS